MNQKNRNELLSSPIAISEEELINELEDKRICKLSDLPEDIYYLHRKETARWLLERYSILKK